MRRRFLLASRRKAIAMSRFLVAVSLVASLTTAALADSAPRMTFAKAPPAVATGDLGDSAGTAAYPISDDVPPFVVDRARLRAKLADARKANLERFRAYQAKGIFPSNVYTSGALNVWRDQDGNYCAAATIIRTSGQTALVDEVAASDNFIKLADVTSGPLMDWILTSGLTQAELALIQRPFVGVAKQPALEPVPETIIAVDPKLRAKETARLAKVYKQIDATLVKQSKASLDAAVDRLLREDARLAYRIAYGS
jgi:uncharacterized protein YbaR (Trm112 family)